MSKEFSKEIKIDGRLFSVIASKGVIKVEHKVSDRETSCGGVRVDIKTTTHVQEFSLDGQSLKNHCSLHVSTLTLRFRGLDEYGPQILGKREHEEKMACHLDHSDFWSAYTSLEAGLLGDTMLNTTCDVSE